MSEDDNPTAAMLAIGDELLSGRTKDKNIGHLAEAMTLIGIGLKEVRIVADDEAAIVEAVNALRERYTYVFTSGGIGGTHDDITADSVSAAFGLPCIYNDEAMRRLAAHYERRGIDFNGSRQRMARMPEGASLIDNPVSTAPGFVIGNVHVMAGVPSIFEAMLDNVIPTLKGGAPLVSKIVECPFGEGDIAARLGEIQKAHPKTSIGSYPRFSAEGFRTQLVIRARAEADAEAAAADIRAMLEAMPGA
ncbi:competence/damage-inducible protein A [Martelella radicis]|uniref:Molybdenum cofactor synthesis domain-containing protein n=1 Tax=Martelella radicis TaxID=1397476 RepID=A0A7W6KMD1_9HYPH|nr:competence/damage-inducible protein A [Martelella radicis]MBB4123888.1 molybdenum cofactor synthesis domain-containing protein [Martelella radicis]